MKSSDLNKGAAGSGPPRPTLSLHLGITGHRPNRLTDQAFELLTNQLEQLFKDVQSVAADTLGRNTEFLMPAPPQLRLVSSLAEGADRIAGHAALRAGFHLTAVLPFASPTYELDFETDESRAEFRGLLDNAETVLDLAGSHADHETRARSYKTAGVMMLRQCDVLIAVWDGKKPMGQGGTAEIVQKAFEGHIPTIWIESSGLSRPCLLHPGSTFAPDAVVDMATELTDESLRTLLKSVLEPWNVPDQTNDRTQSSEVQIRMRQFFGDSIPWWSLAIAYPLMLALLLVRPISFRDIYRRNFLKVVDDRWKDYFRLLPSISGATRSNLKTILEPRYAWADALASHYAERYRSAFVTSFSLATGAVACALMPLLFVSHEVAFALLEIIFIAAVAAVVAVGAVRRWHERWVDYRHLAELLRHLRILSLTNSSVQMPEVSDQDSGSIWINWYYRMTVRNVGTVGTTIDRNYCVASAELFRETEVSEQLKYHRKNEWRAAAVGSRLETIGVILFAATAAACIGSLFNGPAMSAHKYDSVQLMHLPAAAYWFVAFIIAKALLPAIGAACFGIRVQGEFTRMAKKSSNMVKSLAEISEHLSMTESGSVDNLAGLSDLAESACHLMIADVADWRIVFREKRLGLPG